MTTDRHVAALGAVDRYNYGDLLFPLVLEGAFRRFARTTQVRAYGLAARTLEGTGALPTRSYRQLLAGIRAGSVQAVVVAGGEVIGAEWTTMLTHLGSRTLERTVRAARKLIGRRLANRLAAGLFGGSTRWPWVFSSNELGVELPVVFNAVGGASSWPSLGPSQRAMLVEALREAAYVSVRDPVTRAYLTEGGVEGVLLSPDSAVVMSELWPLLDLERMVRDELKDLHERTPYFVVQTNLRVGASLGTELARQAQRLADTKGLQILPLPIGRVSGHDDAIALRPIAASRAAIGLPEDLNIWEIMYLIARARLFVGTSLHGSITALAFATPHLAFTSMVPKLTAHLEAWSDPRLRRPAEVSTFVDAATAAMEVPRDDLAHRSAEVRAAAWKNLESVCLAAVSPAA